MTRKILLRTASLVLALLLLVLSLTGCSASRKVRANALAGRVVATAGDADILYETLYYLAMNEIARMKAEDPNVFDDPAAYTQLETFVKENLVSQNDAIISLGKDYGFDPDKGEVKSAVQERMDEILANPYTFNGDRKAYIESLNAEYLTDRFVRNFIAATEILPDLIIDKLLADGTIDDSDEKARERINEENFIRVVQIELYSYNWGGAEGAKAKAEELRQRVLSKESEAERRSEWWEIWKFGTQGDMMGNGSYYARTQVDKTYESVLDLPLYGISEVLPIDGGYALVMRMPMDETYINENFEEMKRKTYYIDLNEKVDKRLSEMPLEMTDFGNSLDLLSLLRVNANGGEWIYPVAIVLGVVVAGGLVCLAYYLHRRKKANGGKNSKK